MTASDELRWRLESLSERQFIVACVDLDASFGDLAVDVAMRHTLQSLARAGSISTKRLRPTLEL